MSTSLPPGLAHFVLGQRTIVRTQNLFQLDESGAGVQPFGIQQPQVQLRAAVFRYEGNIALQVVDRFIEFFRVLRPFRRDPQLVGLAVELKAV